MILEEVVICHSLNRIHPSKVFIKLRAVSCREYSEKDQLNQTKRRELRFGVTTFQRPEEGGKALTTLKILQFSDLKREIVWQSQNVSKSFLTILKKIHISI